MNKNEVFPQNSQTQYLGLVNNQYTSYATNWAKHADHNHAHGYYDWKCSFVAGYKHILEVGVGDGIATHQLCQNGANVIGIDCNPECLQRADTKLKSAGIDVRCEYRATVTIEGNKFQTTYGTIDSRKSQYTALLLQGDIIAEEDPILANWLCSQSPFDAVICWMIGTNSARYLSVQGGPEMYRLLVQNRTYEIADKILRPGGILHFVDRGPAQVDQPFDVAEELLASHKDQASVTSLIVESDSLDSHPYIRPASGTGIFLGFENSQDEIDLPSNMVLRSIIARKP